MFTDTFMVCYSSIINWIYLDQMLCQQKYQLTMSPFESPRNLLDRNIEDRKFKSITAKINKEKLKNLKIAPREGFKKKN